MTTVSCKRWPIANPALFAASDDVCLRDVPRTAPNYADVTATSAKFGHECSSHVLCSDGQPDDDEALNMSFLTTIYETEITALKEQLRKLEYDNKRTLMIEGIASQMRRSDADGALTWWHLINEIERERYRAKARNHIEQVGWE